MAANLYRCRSCKVVMPRDTKDRTCPRCGGLLSRHRVFEVRRIVQAKLDLHRFAK